MAAATSDLYRAVAARAPSGHPMADRDEAAPVYGRARPTTPQQSSAPSPTVDRVTP